MNCPAVRDRMPELALGSLPARDTELIDRHLAWCAACRKEAGDLHHAAAVLPFALAPAVPPQELEESVVATVREVVGGRASRAPARRVRSAGAAVVAAMVAVAALGWGAVMAGRADRLRDQVRAAREARQEAIERFSGFLDDPLFQDARNDVLLGTLAGPPGSPAGGDALALTSPSGKDLAIVSVTGLPPADLSRLPYKVTLESANGGHAMIGKIFELDTGGSAQIGGEFKRDLSGLTQVVVRDAEGTIVMFGTLVLRAAVPTPSP